MTRSFANVVADLEKQSPQQPVRSRLRRSGIDSVPRLVSAAQHARGDAVQLYIWVLGRCAGPRVEAELLEILEGNRPSLWMHASSPVARGRTAEHASSEIADCNLQSTARLKTAAAE